MNTPANIIAPPLFDLEEPVREGWAGNRIVRVTAWQLWPPRLALDGVTRLCRWCAKPLEGQQTSYCSAACRNDLWTRASLPALRNFVFERDKGACRRCGLDIAALKEIGRWIEQKRYEIQSRDPANWKLVQHWPFATTLYRALGFRVMHLWEVNHIVAIIDGGDPVDPTNMELLCELCHRKHTADVVKRLAKAKRVRKKFHNGVTA